MQIRYLLPAGPEMATGFTSQVSGRVPGRRWKVQNLLNRRQAELTERVNDYGLERDPRVNPGALQGRRLEGNSQKEAKA